MCTIGCRTTAPLTSSCYWIYDRGAVVGLRGAVVGLRGAVVGLRKLKTVLKAFMVDNSESIIIDPTANQ